MQAKNASSTTLRCLLGLNRHQKQVTHLAFSAVVALVTGGAGSAVMADDPLPVDKQNSPMSTKMGAHAMVEAIVNKNPEPKLAGARRSPMFEPNYDWSEYQRAWDAIPILVRNAEDAWPELVKHLDDERYCTTFQSESGATYSWSVGTVCRKIVVGNLSEAYYRELEPVGIKLPARLRVPDIARDNKKLKAWCEKRSKAKLYELQIEMCKWAQTELRRPDADPIVSELRTRAWVAGIEARIESLRESETAVSFNGFGSEEIVPYSPEKAARVQARQREEP